MFPNGFVDRCEKPNYIIVAGPLIYEMGQRSREENKYGSDDGKFFYRLHEESSYVPRVFAIPDKQKAAFMR